MKKELKRLEILVPIRQCEEIQQLVKEGMYNNISEFVRDALRLNVARIKALPEFPTKEGE